MLTFLNPHRIRVLQTFVKLSILFIFLLGNFLNLQVGWADNGDFLRLAQWFSSQPDNYEVLPTVGTPAWQERFFYYFVPQWKLDFPNTSPLFVSAVGLWYPGVLINRYLYSAYTLYLPIMSLGPRLALLLFLWLVFYWIDRRSKHPLIFYLTLVLPLALLFSTSDVVAFFNSFYQETGSIVFVPFLLATLVIARLKPRKWPFYLLYLVAVTLVTTSKTACFYWAFIALPFVISLAQIRSKPFYYIPLGVLLIGIPLILGIKLTHVPSHGPVREYNSLFTGTLLLSNDPQKQLTELGMPEAIQCVGIDIYGSSSTNCLDQFSAKISYFAVLRTMISEPQIMVRQTELVSGMLQNYTLALGKYILGDQTKLQNFRLNFWSEIKNRYFPRNWALLAALLISGLIIFFGYRRPGIVGDLAAVALICLVSFFVDIFVEIIGDGQRDLLKHLFMPNMFFDFLMISVVNIGGILAFGWLLPRIPHFHFSSILKRLKPGTKD